MDARTKAKLIRKAVKEAGYDYWFTFNDKNKDGTRRIKCMRNGYDFGVEQYNKWLDAIKQSLKDQQVEYSYIGFDWCDAERGDCVAFVCRISD